MADSHASDQYELVPHSYQGALIQQRASDGYINATAMCKAAGKKWNDYARLSTTSAFMSELSSVAGIPATELTHSIQGGNPDLQGTWIHPQVAIHLAQWLSAAFAVRVSASITRSRAWTRAFAPIRRKASLAAYAAWKLVRTIISLART